MKNQQKSEELKKPSVEAQIQYLKEVLNPTDKELSEIKEKILKRQNQPKKEQTSSKEPSIRSQIEFVKGLLNPSDKIVAEIKRELIKEKILKILKKISLNNDKN